MIKAIDRRDGLPYPYHFSPLLYYCFTVSKVSCLPACQT